MKNKKSLSIIIPTLNSEKHLVPFFAYLKNQNFPKDQLEILVVDGGSKDDTLRLAQENDVKVINNPDVLAEPGVTLGFKNAQAELMMVLATDNYLIDKDYLKKMVQVFEDPQIEAAISDIISLPEYNFLNQYLNRFTDPFSHFVYGDAACLRDYHKVYKEIKKNSKLVVYDFNSSASKPILAFAQGMTIRKGFARKQEDAFDDIAPIYDLIANKKQIAYVFSTNLVHNSLQTVAQFVRKTQWASLNFLNKTNYGIAHRANTLTSWQKIKIKIWPFYAFSIVLPILNAMRGLIIDKESRWLYHPIMCFLSAYGSAKAVMRYLTKKGKIDRQN